MKCFSSTSTLLVIKAFYLMAAPLLFTGCTNSMFQEGREKSFPDQIRISVRIPEASLPGTPATKSQQTQEEMRIEQVQVLVFENGLYSYKAQGLGISQTDNFATFHARVRESNVSTTLFVVANNNALVETNEPAIGTPIDQVRTNFNIPFTASGIAPNYAMWGSHTFGTGIGPTPFDLTTPIALLRAVARVDVHVAPTASNFTLETVQVFRAANSIQLIPDSPNTELSVTLPSIPAGTSFNVNTAPVNASSPVASEAQVYVPESTPPSPANQVSQATCVVVGGRFNNSAVTRYYRLDFNPQFNDHTLGQILRNCRYDFSINEVSADGFNTPAEAADNASSNMVFTLAFWPGDQIRHMFFDNFDYFGLSAVNVGLGALANDTKQIDVATNLSGYALRFGTDGPWQQNLDNGTFSVTRTNGDETLVVTALTNNFTTGYVKQTMQVQAGNLENITVEIVQVPFILNIEFATRNVGAFRTFVQNVQDFGGHFQWDRTAAFPVAEGQPTPPVGWNPGAISTSLTWQAANDPCPTGWRLPTEDEWLWFRVLYPALSRRTVGTLAAPGNGTWFAPTQAEADNATFANPGNAIFFPGAGWRAVNGALAFTNNSEISGHYWAANRTFERFSLFILDVAVATGRPANISGYSVRCVRDL